MKVTASIVVPVYQNEANLGATIPCLLSLQEQLGKYDVEVILVDDGSTDASLEIISRFARDNPAVVKGIKLTRNFGQQAAIAAGIEAAKGEWVVIISADLQEPYQLIPEMVAHWERGSKFVIGERVHRSEGLFHRGFSSIYWGLIRRFAFPDFPRMGFDFCLIDRDVATYVTQSAEKNTSIFTLLFWLGFKPTSVPIERKDRVGGRSQWTLRKKLNITVDTLIGFTHLPARFITLFSFAAMFSAVFYGAIVLFNWATAEQIPAGWTTIVGLILIFGAMILFALGIISEYLLRILDATRRRPLVVKERVIECDLAKDDS